MIDLNWEHPKANGYGRRSIIIITFEFCWNLLIDEIGVKKTVLSI
jgi:hypothetical protein